MGRALILLLLLIPSLAFANQASKWYYNGVYTYPTAEAACTVIWSTQVPGQREAGSWSQGPVSYNSDNFNATCMKSCTDPNLCGSYAGLGFFPYGSTNRTCPPPETFVPGSNYSQCTGGPVCVAGVLSSQNYMSCQDLDGDGLCEGNPSVTPSTYSLCVGGCTALFSGSIPSISCQSYQNVDGTFGPSIFCSAQYSTSGDTCSTGGSTPAPIVPAATSCPAGTVAGTFNNKNLCLPSASPKPPITTTTTGGSQPPPGTTVTNNVDGSTTTTTTINNNDGTSTTTTTTSKPPGSKAELGEAVDDYCQKNPSALACKKPDDFCEKNPESIGCMKAGTPENQTLGESNISFSITPVSVGSSGSCPANISLPKGMSFSFTPICTYATTLRPLVLAFAWLTAGLIAFGFKGD